MSSPFSNPEINTVLQFGNGRDLGIWMLGTIGDLEIGNYSETFRTFLAIADQRGDMGFGTHFFATMEL